MTPGPDHAPARRLHDPASVHRIAPAVAAVILGKDEIIAHAVVALVAGGHLLLEDLPGVGKSTLARCLATAVGGELARIQFTSDLLPADILGFNAWRPNADRFEFRPGPIFANFVLADEVNRAPPRTQSALLEAMGENTVSTDGVSRALPDPFMVLATQNPLEHHGTYPLPESQRDRFTLRLSLGYAASQIEADLLARPQAPDGGSVPCVCSCEAVAAARKAARAVFVHADLAGYAQRVVAATRSHAGVRLGVSTRGALAWVAAARAHAWIAGREHVGIDDLQQLAIPALAHRIVVADGDPTGAHTAASALIGELVATVQVPA